MNAASQSWSAGDYAENGRFVSDLGAPVLDLLAAQPGERILDLGCGDGALTEKIAATGTQVLGIDTSEELLAAARARGLQVRRMDAQQLTSYQEFDAVFSNAALHWMKRPEDVLRGVRQALKPHGRFVGEFGGHGNIAAVYTALLAVLARRGVNATPYLLFFPKPEQYRRLLESHGFRVESIALIPRPTPLPTGMKGWLNTFASSFFAALPEEERAAAQQETVRLLRPILCDTRGQWTAGYMRLRFVAHCLSVNRFSI
ncbi:MAG: methyltransferase domain-containing protein [Acidobacteriaceae bacterium]